MKKSVLRHIWPTSFLVWEKKLCPGKTYFVFVGQNLFWAEKILSRPDKILFGQKRLCSRRIKSFFRKNISFWPDKIFFAQKKFCSRRTKLGLRKKCFVFAGQ